MGRWSSGIRFLKAGLVVPERLAIRGDERPIQEICDTPVKDVVYETRNSQLVEVRPAMDVFVCLYCRWRKKLVEECTEYSTRT